MIHLAIYFLLAESVPPALFPDGAAKELAFDRAGSLLEQAAAILDTL